MAHGSPGHDHQDACVQGGIYTTQQDCYVYAPDGHTITKVLVYLAGARLMPEAAPDSVFLDPRVVDGDMDISAPEVLAHRVYYSDTHFVSRSYDGQVFVSSSGAVSKGDSIVTQIAGTDGTTVAAQKLVEANYIEEDVLSVDFKDGPLCQLNQFGSGLSYDSSGYFWGNHPGERAHRVKACIQVKVRVEITVNDDTKRQVDFWLKDNDNGRDSVFSSAYPSHGPIQSADAAAVSPSEDAVTVALAADRKRVSEDNGKATFTVSLSRPLASGESVRVPLRVTGGRAYRDWNIRLRERESGPGVTRTAAGSFSELLFTEGGQTATLVLIGRPDDDVGDRRIKIALGRGARKPASAGVAEGIVLGNRRIRITIADSQG